MTHGWCAILIQTALVATVRGHGRLMEPPARNSMWRFGYPNPVNYNDNELFCGGYAVQWDQNGGKCGLCGDAYHMNTPRPHEAGGEYARGIISRHYVSGQEIEVEVELTANHQGRFEMYLCPNNNPAYEATQECFEKYPLRIVQTGGMAFHIPADSGKQGTFRYTVRLPPYVTCTQCVVQWTYFTGNMWGRCENGTEAVGCGKAETFRNCADISILSLSSNRPPSFANPFLLYIRDLRSPAPYNVYPLIVREQVCIPTQSYRRYPGMDHWCQTNCLRYPPNCPESTCYCPTTCEAIGELKGREGADVYCLDKCINFPSKNCPADRCRCY